MSRVAKFVSHDGITEKILFSMGTEEQTLHTTMSASDFVTRKTKQVQKTLLL